MWQIELSNNNGMFNCMLGRPKPPSYLVFSSFEVKITGGKVEETTVLSGTGGRKTVVVMFLGGITRTEIAALRFLGRAEGGRKILICTTGVVSGNTMMEAAMQGGRIADS